MNVHVETYRARLQSHELTAAAEAATVGLRSNERSRVWGDLFLTPTPLPWSLLSSILSRRRRADPALAAALAAVWVAEQECRADCPEGTRLLIDGAFRCVLHILAPDADDHRARAADAYAVYFGCDRQTAEAIVDEVALASTSSTFEAVTWVLAHGDPTAGAMRLVTSHDHTAGGPPQVRPDIVRFGFPALSQTFLAGVRTAGELVREGRLHTRGGVRWHLESSPEHTVTGDSAGAAFWVAFRAVVQRARIDVHAAASVALTHDGTLREVAGVDDKLEAAARAGVDRVIVRAIPGDVRQAPPTTRTGEPIEVIHQVESLDDVWRAMTERVEPPKWGTRTLWGSGRLPVRSMAAAGVAGCVLAAAVLRPAAPHVEPTAVGASREVAALGGSVINRDGRKPSPRLPVVPGEVDNRPAAEAVIAVGGGVLVPGKDPAVVRVDDLPREPFPLIGVNLNLNPRADDALLARLNECRRLTVLRLGNTRVTDTGLAAVGFDREGLTDIDLYMTNVTDAGLRRFQGCPALTYLQLGKTGLTDVGLRHFADCSQLRHAGLDATDVTDDGLKIFRATPFLETLSLLDTAVSDEGMAHLESCTQLRRLELSRTNVTAQGAARIRRLLPQCDVRHPPSGP